MPDTIYLIKKGQIGFKFQPPNICVACFLGGRTAVENEFCFGDYAYLVLKKNKRTGYASDGRKACKRKKGHQVTFQTKEILDNIVRIMKGNLVEC